MRHTKRLGLAALAAFGLEVAAATAYDRSLELAAESPRDPRLARGAAGDSARVLQDLLCGWRRTIGLRPILIDGIFGRETEGVVRDLQREALLPVTGVVDDATWAALHDAIGRDPLGRIDPATTAVTPDAYRRTRGSSRDVRVHLLPSIEVSRGVRVNPLAFEAGMAIDADGAGNAWRSDPWGQPSTSLRWSSGRSLDPTVTPFYVLPNGFAAKHDEVRKGDVAAVFYQGKVAYAIYGDAGPRDKLGEGSIALARALGIPSSPRGGGTGSGVIYVVFPRSGDETALSNDEIARRGAALLKAAGGNPP